MKRVVAIACVCLGAAASVACAGTPEQRLPHYESAGLRLPYSYENTRCFAACPETIAQLKAEEEALKRAEAERKAAEAAEEARRTRKKSSSTSPRSATRKSGHWARGASYSICGGCGKKSYPPEFICSSCDLGGGMAIGADRIWVED